MTKAYSRFLTALFALFLGGMLVMSLLLCTAYLVDGSYNPLLSFRF